MFRSPVGQNSFFFFSKECYIPLWYTARVENKQILVSFRPPIIHTHPCASPVFCFFCGAGARCGENVSEAYAARHCCSFRLMVGAACAPRLKLLRGGCFFVLIFFCLLRTSVFFYKYYQFHPLIIALRLVLGCWGLSVKT